MNTVVLVVTDTVSKMVDAADDSCLRYLMVRYYLIQGPHYLIGDWGQWPTCRGILRCFEEIGENWLAFKNNKFWCWITYFVLYKQISIRNCKKSCFRQKTFNFACLFCFSFGVGEFFLKVGGKYILVWEWNDALFQAPKIIK